ncbi:MAG: type II toxin-antitoxin system prevent-host-death family antitoxin [Candidatus Jacksonbacteria bacterium]
MTKTINAYKLRTNLGEFLNEVYYKGDEIIIERRGKPLVKIVKIKLEEIRMNNNKMIPQKDRLLKLAGALSSKRAEEMERVIYNGRKTSARFLNL